MEKENILFLINLFIMVNSVKVVYMVEESLKVRKVIYTEVNGITIECRVKVVIYIIMVVNMKV